MTEDLAHITAANARDSPLLRLPAELRNRVYEYVFDDVRFHVDKTTTQIPSPQHYSRCITSSEVHVRFRIPSTCRQIFAETAVMPYRSAVLEFTSPQRLMNWLRDLPPGVRGNVRKVSFYKSSVAGLISRETASDSNVGAQQHDWLIEACSSLQGLERVHLGTYTRTFDTELTAGVEFLQEQLVKSDGRKVEVVLRTRVLS